MFFFQFDVNRIEWLNMVFENRNQSYGAYELRLKSGRYLRNALVCSAVGFSLLIVAPSVVQLSNNDAELSNVKSPSLPDEDKAVFLVQEVDMLPKQKMESTPTTSSAAKNEFKQIDYTTPHVVPDHLAADAPTVADIQTATISHINQEGPESMSMNTTPGTMDGKGSSGSPGEGEEAAGNVNSLVNFAEVMPEFPGGMTAWNKYLQKNLNYPSVAAENGVTGRVVVSFVVERDGKLTDIKILRGIGSGCDEEAIRVIKNSPLWKPGEQNGKKVRVAYVVPIVFQLN